MRVQVVVAALLALASLSAHAQTCSATLSWTPPTQNTDGTPLTNLASYKIYWGTNAAPPFPNSQTVAAPATGYVVTGLSAATLRFAVSSVNSAGTESALSNVASKTTTGCSTPNPPTNLTVQADLTAWAIQTSRDRVARVPVGTVAPGTPCDVTQPVLGLYVVPRAAVTFAGSVRPEVVLASCG